MNWGESSEKHGNSLVFGALGNSRTRFALALTILDEDQEVPLVSSGDSCCHSTNFDQGRCAMRVSIACVALLLLPVIAGCEGNSPRRSPFASTASPASAKTVEYAPSVKGAAPAARPAGDPGAAPAAIEPMAAANPAANAPITIDGNKLETRRQQLNFHTAIFLKKEVGGLTTTGLTENNNFVFRTVEGLNKFQITSAVYTAKADKGKPPQTVEELKNLIGEFLTELQPNEFYVYDPDSVTEPNKEEMLYLQQYP
jgi:hypothetical protein